jgi:hypothetical protein
MSDKPELPTVVLARFKTIPPRGCGAPVEFPVHFNPASLQYTVANTLKEESSGGKKKQFVDKTTAKLTMQLVFDTTHNGEDVRKYTDKTAGLLKPVPQGSKQVPPNVEFGWGLYRFTGMVETYKETIDFFSADGVPLRASVDLTLASQDVQFTSGQNPNASVDEPPSPEPAVLPGAPSPTDVANSVGDPRSARAIAAANGSASLRFGGGVGLSVGASVEIQAEAAFSAGASAGFGIGGGAGIGIGGAAGIGIGGAAGASIGGAAGGAFAGLRTSVSAPTSMPSASAVLASSAKVGSVGASAQFGFGGQAQMEAGASLGADVGADADLNALIRFG